MNNLGRADLSPGDAVIAGSFGTWRLTYTAGDTPIQPGGRIQIYCDSDTDRALLQFNDPSAPDYATVTAPDGVQVDTVVQGWKAVTLTLNGAPLSTTQSLTVTFGDTSGGSPGWRSQTFLESIHTYHVSIAPTVDAPFQDLSDSPSVSIVGGDLAKLTIVAPSTAVRDRPFRLLVRVEDAWGNPASLFRGTVDLTCDGVDLEATSLDFDETHAGIRWLESCTATALGLLTVHGAVGAHRAHSNPIRVTDAPEAFDLFWGDYHGGQVENASKIADFFRYARDVTGIQFVSYQRNDHAHSDEDYATQLKAERQANEPRRFVAIPGFEWSPATSVGGHHNVYFRRFDQPMRRWTSARLGGHDTSNDLPHIRDLYRAYRNTDTVITPHVGGNHSNLTWHEPTLEPAVEITSDHGTFEWMLEEVFEYNYRLGFFGGSDSHTGRPGYDLPGHQHRRYAKSGLAAVYAEDVTIDSLLDALKARRCYATTGARIQVRTESSGHLMGSEYTSSTNPEVSVSIAGTAPLESVELYNGLEKVYTHPIDTPDRPMRIRVLWEGASRKNSYSGVVWEGVLSVEGATLSGLEKIRFDSPRSYLFGERDNGFSCYSVTCGYRSGVVFDVNAADATLTLAAETTVMTGPKYEGHGESGALRISHATAERITSTIRLDELAEGPRTIEIGTLNRRVTISLSPEPTEEAAEFIFTDPCPRPGINPYWLRVVQVDQEMAWSSPIYVDYAAPR